MNKELPRLEVDIESSSFVRDPFPIYAQMRRDFPVCEIENRGQRRVFVTRYEDSKAVLSDHDSFRSASDVIAKPKGIEDRYKRDLFVLTMDPPEHTRYRSLVAKAFVPKVLVALEPFVTSVAEDLVENVLRKNSVDFLSAFSLPYTVAVIGQITGDTSQTVEDLRYWTELVDRNSDAVQEPEHAKALEAATAKQYSIYERIIAERRSNSRDDLISELLKVEIDGEKLTELNIRSALDLFVSAGFQSSAQTLTNAVYLLGKYPETFRTLKAHPDKIAPFVDEVLRFLSPAHSLLRRASRDTEINGVRVPANSLISVVLASANRDERRFENPEIFDIDRPDIKKQIGFGHGVHTCIGASLARLEVTIAIRCIVKHFNSVECADDENLEWFSTLIIRALHSLPVAFE